MLSPLTQPLLVLRDLCPTSEVIVVTFSYCSLWIPRTLFKFELIGAVGSETIHKTKTIGCICFCFWTNLLQSAQNGLPHSAVFIGLAGLYRSLLPSTRQHWLQHWQQHIHQIFQKKKTNKKKTKRFEKQRNISDLQTQSMPDNLIFSWD